MPLHPARLPLLFTALLSLLLGGCFYYPDNGTYTYAQRGPGPAYAAAPSTALVIVMPDNSTEADYLNWRGQIIDYLIQRGYIASESDLVANPDNAQRIVRAIVGNGGYTLSVFNKDGGVAAEAAPLYLEDSDVCYPEDPYFILGFAYFGEIGARHLPPRPPGYRPHPRPDNYRPPANRPNYDWNRHWSGPHDNAPGGRPHTPDRPQDNHNDNKNDHRGPDHGDQPHNPPTQPNRPPPDDHRDRPGRDDHTPTPPPAKPAPSDHRTDNRPYPDRNGQPVTTPPPRSLPANNPPPRAPDRPVERQVERPAPPPPKQQESKPDPKDDDKRNQQER
jgi:hypothetical protein